MATLNEQLATEKEYNNKLKEERQKLLLELQEKNKQAQNQTYLKALQADYILTTRSILMVAILK